jgi:hypothetical protein
LERLRFGGNVVVDVQRITRSETTVTVDVTQNNPVAILTSTPMGYHW